MSRMDDSNGLLYGLPKCTVSGLQAVQYSAARIVTQERLRDHDSMSRAFMELHWVPVDKRIEYKLLLYTYKALHGLAPGYLCELVVAYSRIKQCYLFLLMYIIVLGLFHCMLLYVY